MTPQLQKSNVLHQTLHSPGDVVMWQHVDNSEGSDRWKLFVQEEVVELVEDKVHKITGSGAG